MTSLSRGIALAGWLVCSGTVFAAASDPPPRGRLVAAGAHRLHIDCRGHGSPTVVVETGLDDFSFDWVLVQERVARTYRICAYDRAGYAWSEPGPKPRTFEQNNLELHEALASAGERGPFLLVGHSYGGGLVRNFALRYSTETAGLVLAEAVGDTQWIPMGHEVQQLRSFAKGRTAPEPRNDLQPGDVPTTKGYGALGPYEENPALAPLPADVRALHRWAMLLPALEDAENSQRDWGVENIARWADSDMAGRLGDLPLVVLMRKDGGYTDGMGRPASELEAERVASQHKLAAWSRRGRLEVVPAGHSLHLEAPDAVARAIDEVARMVKRAR